MAFRIYTKTGDKGETGLFGGHRLPKDDIRIEAYGTVDELNAVIGHLADNLPANVEIPLLRAIQEDLFTIGSHLATKPGSAVKLPPLPAHRIREMEACMDDWDSRLPSLKHFILPGGHTSVSGAHLARCVCRRAERRTVSLDRMEPVDAEILTYLNRLSDLLFMAARKLAFDLGVEEIRWDPAG